jgi:hypothetical protein
MEQDREVILLKLKDAIADKEWFTAAANHDTAKFGEWQCNWAEGIIEASSKIDTAFRLLGGC